MARATTGFAATAEPADTPRAPAAAAPPPPPVAGNVVPHCGHLIFLPAHSSLTRSPLPHLGQVNEIAIEIPALACRPSLKPAGDYLPKLTRGQISAASAACCAWLL